MVNYKELIWNIIGFGLFGLALVMGSISWNLAGEDKVIEAFTVLIVFVLISLPFVLVKIYEKQIYKIIQER
jgi:4-amino-4-deoxy-L-arabinose transferase-like glycosyltransferase